MLVTTRDLLSDAQRNKYAVGAFNVENMEMVLAVLKAAEDTQSPIIMQTTPGTLKYAGADMYFANIRAAARRTKIPVACHLDHGSSLAVAVQAFRAGYTSIMIDGSKLPFAENIALTKSVVEICHAANIPVEAELGRVGGKEDNLDNTGSDNPYTDPEEAAVFVDERVASKMTNDYVLEITDYALPEDLDSLSDIWQQNFEELHRNTGL